MAYLTTGLIADILSRLPVKSLLRFRCVAKTWRFLIDDRFFIKSHINRSMKTKNNLNLIVRTKNEINSVPFDTLDGVLVELEWPFKQSIYKAEFMGCCDGLICLGIGEGNAAIWNPTTRKHRKLPAAPIAFPDKYKGSTPGMIFDIGYDSVSDDYKVVRIVDFPFQVCDLEVRVYSMKLNAWRKVQGFPYHFYNARGVGRQVSVLVSGALHWIAYHSEDLMKISIVAFGLTTEEHRLFPMPEYDEEPNSWILGELEGRLCVFYNYIGTRADVWVMKDYGVKDSWSLLFSVPHEYPSRFEIVVPLMYSKSGSRVLMVQYCKRFIWYDVERKTREDITTPGLPLCFGTKICVESLVPVNGDEDDGNEQDRQEEEEEEKKKKKKQKTNS